MPTQVSAAVMTSVRASVLGYSDGVLAGTKARIAEELDLDASDMDAVLADRFNAERCTGCGHWFDRHQCDHHDGHGGFECGQCAAQN